MANDISLPSPSINPGAVGGSSGFAPNALDNFIASYLGAQQQKSSESVEARKFELAQSQFDLEKGKQDAMLAQMAHEHEMEQQRGKTVQAVLKIFGDTMGAQAQATGTLPPALQGMMGDPSQKPNPFQSQGQQQPQAGPMAPQAPIGAPSPVSAQAQAIPQSTATPVPNWAQLAAGMNPEAAAAFVEKDLPHLLEAQKSGSDPGYEQANTGGMNTVFNKKTGLTFDPSKGLPMSDARAWSPAVPHTQTADQRAEANARIALAEEQAAAQRAYRGMMENQGFAKQFDSRTKTLRERAPILQQAAMSLNAAANAPDIHDRQVLGTTAVIQFLQAADQKGQLRSTLVQMASSGLDPSVTGTINKWVSRNYQGTLPPYILTAMQHHVNNLITLTRKEYERQYIGEMKRRPNPLLVPPDDIFSPQTVAPASSGAELPPPPMVP